MDDAAGFFAKVFGGDRFEDYVRNPYPRARIGANNISLRLDKFPS